MTENREKSNLEKYNDLVSRRNNWKEKSSLLENSISSINSETKAFEKKMSTLENYASKIEALDSQISMIEPIKDIKALSDTCKAHLMNVFVTARYGRIKDIKLKYFEKGLMQEETAIDVYSFATNTYFEKNKLRKSNTYLTGEIDFQSGDFVMIYDTKVSWNIFTFWGSLAKGVTDIEWWQMQAYMWLFNMPRAKICKILVDTPDKLIENEKRDLLREFIGTPEEYEEACAEIDRLHKYQDIPNEERIIELEIERDDEAIERIPGRVEECRDFLNNIKPGSYYENNRANSEQGVISR
jgi:hypothetical protein